MRTRIGASIVAVVLFVAFIFADSTRGDIAGKVVDEAGAALPGVHVTLVGSIRRNAVTDARGEFTFKSLPPGTYETRFELAGFSVTTAKVEVHANRVEHLSIKMRVGSLTETVSVAAETPAQTARESGKVTNGAPGGVVGGMPATVAGLPPMAGPVGYGAGGYFPGRYTGPLRGLAG